MKRSNGRFAAGRELFEFLLANDLFLEEGSDAVLATGKARLRVDEPEDGRAREEDRPVRRRLGAGREEDQGGTRPRRSWSRATRRRSCARASSSCRRTSSSFPGEQLDVIDTPAFMRATTSAA